MELIQDAPHEAKYQEHLIAESRRGHPLLTQELKDRFRELGPQDHPRAIVVAKYFHPFSDWTWYATAYDPKDELFFGLVHGMYTELGYFGLHDLKGLINGLPFERDLHWNECILSDLQAMLPPRG